MDVTSSAVRKFRRGVEQVQTISGEARTFQDGHAYELRIESELRSPEEIHYDCYAIERKAPPDHWPLLVGEALHNLRCALDHLIYTAANRARGTAFPIFIDPCEFQVIGRPVIRRAPSAIRTVVYDAQPFNTIPATPRWDPLAVLNRFDNRDKHRELATVAGFVDLPYVGSNGANIEFTCTGEGRPLHNDTHVVSFTVRGPEAEQVKVSPDFAYEVRLEGIPLIQTLEGIVWRVEQVILACEQGIPLPVWLRPLGHDES